VVDFAASTLMRTLHGDPKVFRMYISQGRQSKSGRILWLGLPIIQVE
jgi:hypothetical protein